MKEFIIYFLMLFVFNFFIKNSYAEINIKSDRFEFKVKGFVKPTYSFSSESVSSFGYPSSSGGKLKWVRDNQLAATEASIQDGVDSPSESRSHFNIGQSRFGATLIKGKSSLVFESDFVDFDHSESATSIRPRLRMIGASFQISEKTSIFAGQDWDIISTDKPFTYNFVSLYFRSGNTGFLRPQLRFTINRRKNENDELFSFAIGASGLNDGSDSIASVERSVLPSVGFRFIPFHSSYYQIGNATLYSSQKQDVNQKETRYSAWISKIFTRFSFNERFTLQSQLFFGSNSQNLGATQSLGILRFNRNQYELGGLVTGHCVLSSEFDLLIGTGRDHLISPQNTNNYQLVDNWVSRIGFSWKFLPQSSAFIEFSHFRSSYALPWENDRLAKSNQAESGLIVGF